MKRARIRRQASALGGIITLVCGLGFTVLPLACGEDLLTLSGTTYRNVRAVRVEPDGVTWEHAGGICKVDFTDSPPAVREAYHYDAAAATAYHTARELAHRQSEEQTRSLVQAHEERKQALAQAVMAANAAGNPAATELILRRAASPAASAAARALGEQVAAENARLAEVRANRDTLLANPRIWRLVPQISGYRPDRYFDVPTALEYQASLHHPAGAFAPDSLHEEFYTPVYSTRSYYEDVDRAAAFARAVPQKP